MARYPLANLLSARLFREEAAEREVLTRTSALEAAEAEREKARAELERYRVWRPGEERRRFEAVKNRCLSLGDLDEHQDDILQLRRAELAREEEAALASGRVEEARNRLADARRVLEAAVRDRRKIEEHRDRWRREENMRLDLAEELELEDFPASRPSDEADVE